MPFAFTKFSEILQNLTNNQTFTTGNVAQIMSDIT